MWFWVERPGLLSPFLSPAPSLSSRMACRGALIPCGIGGVHSRFRAGEAQDAADFFGRGQARFDGRTGALPAIDHPRSDRHLLELTDVASCQDGRRQVAEAIC